MQTVFILAIGAELLDGRVLESNSRYIANQLNDFAIEVSGTLVCPDDMERISD
ncbi:MAG: hypothetical protein KDD42_04105, partial [Bdellovibrionales bacterium]|nr:hypothetical protein [Bdellovibrionales bacterium]